MLSKTEYPKGSVGEHIHHHLWHEKALRGSHDRAMKWMKKHLKGVLKLAYASLDADAKNQIKSICAQVYLDYVAPLGASRAEVLFNAELQSRGIEPEFIK